MIMSFFGLFLYLTFIRLLDVRAWGVRRGYKHEHRIILGFKNFRYFYLKFLLKGFLWVTTPLPSSSNPKHPEGRILTVLVYFFSPYTQHKTLDNLALSKYFSMDAQVLDIVSVK